MVSVGAALFGDIAVCMHGIYGGTPGADPIAGAVMETVFVLVANTLLRPIANSMNPRPIDTETTEVTYTVTVIAPRTKHKEALSVLEQELESANYPVSELDALMAMLVSPPGIAAA